MPRPADAIAPTPAEGASATPLLGYTRTGQPPQKGPKA
jgi:hypothetical protein